MSRWQTAFEAFVHMGQRSFEVSREAHGVKKRRTLPIARELGFERGELVFVAREAERRSKVIVQRVRDQFRHGERRASYWPTLRSIAE